MSSQNTPKLDYLAPDVSELASQRGSMLGRPSDKSNTHHVPISRMVARRLLPACVVVPAVCWWALLIGAHRGMYSIQTCFMLFDLAVTVIFGSIVCLDLRRLAKMDRQRLQTQEQLKFAKEAAEQANRFKSMFFANISHEIRTPLTAINGFAELALNPDRPEEQRLSDARVIRRNGEHLLTLINDILDLSKIEAGKMTVDRISCCPARIVGEVCSMLRQRATEKGLELNVNFAGPIPKTVRTDPTRLRQVLINLLANAIKFTAKGSVNLTISVKPSFRDANPELEVKITDTGIGMSAEQKASLFQAFVQADSTISRRYGGSGLGLAISRHFAQALGGDISVDSEVGKGSTFIVTIATDSLAGVAVEDNPQEAMESNDTFNTPRVSIKGSVLVAEDGSDNQVLIGEKLRETGLKVEIAPNGQVAFEKALTAQTIGRPFDLILMDVQMPIMDGFTATQELRSKGYRGPIIALTANAMERDRNKCLSAGCNDFVTKPIQMDKLFAAIGRYLKVTKVVKEPAKPEAAAVATPNRASLVEKFYQDLPTEIEQIEEAVERQDRERLTEVAQLLLGKAATAGLKDLAPQVAKLLQSVESEQSWIVLQQVTDVFATETRDSATRQAA